MRKEKKRALAQKRAAGELDENEEEKLRAPKRPRMSKEEPFCQLVVDLGFDEKMSDNVSGWLFEHTTSTFFLPQSIDQAEYSPASPPPPPAPLHPHALTPLTLTLGSKIPRLTTRVHLLRQPTRANAVQAPLHGPRRAHARAAGVAERCEL